MAWRCGGAKDGARQRKGRRVVTGCAGIRRGTRWTKEWAPRGRRVAAVRLIAYLFGWNESPLTRFDLVSNFVSMVPPPGARARNTQAKARASKNPMRVPLRFEPDGAVHSRAFSAAAEDAPMEGASDPTSDLRERARRPRGTRKGCAQRPAAAAALKAALASHS